MPQISYSGPVCSLKILPTGAGSMLLEARSLCMETDLDVLESSVYLVYCLDSGRPLVAIQRQTMANQVHINHEASWGSS